ncbi:substance-K receptor-like [Amphiura filiformis]|uniref:substance-K receptor-like n=1 Tax=Amphiura filiformis TaxID=82378 RepID=UPI003B21C2AC
MDEFTEEGPTYYDENSTMETSQNDYHAQPPGPDVNPAVLWAKIISFAIIIVLTIVGNSIVVIIILRNKHMRTVTYYYLMNLAVADIAIAIFTEWTWLHHHFYHSWIFGKAFCKFSTVFQGRLHHHFYHLWIFGKAFCKFSTDFQGRLHHHFYHSWIFGKAFCKFSTVFQAISVHVSILTLTVVAGDRYFAILYPLKSRVIKRNAGVVIAAVWAIAIIVNIPLVIHVKYITHTWDDGISQAWCVEYWDDNQIIAKNKKKHYSLSLFVLVYIIPLFIMMVAYLRIAMTLGARSTHGPGVNVESTISAQERARRKVIKMLIVVVSTFALCWLPYHMMILYRDWIPHAVESESAFFVCLWLGYANSAMNPFIYCGFNENFRRGFRDAFTCQLFKKQQSLVKPNNKSVCSSHTDGTVLESML